MGDLVKINILSLNSLTQQNSIKDLDTMKANRCIASCSCFYQNTTLEHTAEAGGQQACTFHASMKGHTSLPISEPQRKREKNHIIMMTLLTTTTSSLTSPQWCQQPNLPSHCQRSTSLPPTPGNYLPYSPLSSPLLTNSNPPTTNCPPVFHKMTSLTVVS